MENAHTHFVLVDFENRALEDLSTLTGHPVIVILFLGQKSRLKKDLVAQIETLPFEVRLIKVGVTRKNAADFVLTYYLGTIMARHPGESYYIISGDDDFESIVTHLTNNHHRVSQHADLDSLPFLTRSKAVEPPKRTPVKKASPAPAKQPEDPRAKVMAYLTNPESKNLPSTRKRLMARVKNDLGKGSSDADAATLVEELSANGALTIAPSNRVAYRGKTPA